MAEGLSVSRYEKSVPKVLNVELSFQSSLHTYLDAADQYDLNAVDLLVDRVTVFDTTGHA